jgi:hypothetical protein
MPSLGVQIPPVTPNSRANYKEKMYKVKWNGLSGVEKILEFSDLTSAMCFSKQLGRFVTISNGNFEVVGKFGVDSVKEGMLPDGTDYSWYKRRKP